MVSSVFADDAVLLASSDCALAQFAVDCDVTGWRAHPNARKVSVQEQPRLLLHM